QHDPRLDSDRAAVVEASISGSPPNFVDPTEQKDRLGSTAAVLAAEAVQRRENYLSLEVEEGVVEGESYGFAVVPIFAGEARECMLVEYPWPAQKMRVAALVGNPDILGRPFDSNDKGQALVADRWYWPAGALVMVEVEGVTTLQWRILMGMASRCPEKVSGATKHLDWHRMLAHRSI
ncbi:MAG: hypothetical protein Q9177_006843, partial [Variospora cf. flavescens]